MDVIFISDLRLDILVGVYDWEKQVPQKVRLDLEIGLPDRKAGNNRLDDTIDYAAVVSRIEATLAENRFGLLENVAERVARLLIEDFGAPRAKVSVAKIGNLANARLVGVTIERKR